MTVQQEIYKSRKQQVARIDDQIRVIRRVKKHHNLQTQA